MRPGIETLASDAIERMARHLGIAVDLDAPEESLIHAVELRIVKLAFTDPDNAPSTGNVPPQHEVKA
jgi:hypothetical protein